MFDEAIVLANRTPCSPQTLTRAARDFQEKKPQFAVAAGLAALRWLIEGYGYDISSVDVINAYSHTMSAADNAGCVEQTQNHLRELLTSDLPGQAFVKKFIGRQLGLA